MCGIIGFYTGAPKYKANRDFITQAIYAGALRGIHGTGLVGVTENDEEFVHKKAIAACDFIELSQTDSFLGRMSQYKCVIGHNRFKTQGNITNRNTHPFQHGHITMVHNGSVNSHMLPGNQEVDSDRIAHALATIGIEETVKKLSGAFTLVWYDSIDKCMRVIRNDERPLWLAKDTLSETVYFASESPMLRWIAWRNNITLEAMYQPKPGTLLTFSGKSATPEARDVPLYVAPVHHYPARGVQQVHTNLVPTLASMGLAHGDLIELHPVSWEPMGMGTPTPASYGNLHLMSVEHSGMFRFAGCRFQEVDAAKSFSCKVLGTSHIDGRNYVTVGQLVPMGENAFEVTNDMVWLRQADPKPKELPLLKADKKGSKEKVEEKSDVALMLPGPGGQLVDEVTYKKFIKHGCCMCGEALDIDEAPLVSFDWQGNVYCDVCIENPIVLKFMAQGGN